MYTTESIQDEDLCIMTDCPEGPRVAESDLVGDVVTDWISGNICRIRSHLGVPSVQPKDTSQQKVCLPFVLICPMLKLHLGSCL